MENGKCGLHTEHDRQMRHEKDEIHQIPFTAPDRPTHPVLHGVYTVLGRVYVSDGSNRHVARQKERQQPQDGIRKKEKSPRCATEVRTETREQ